MLRQTGNNQIIGEPDFSWLSELPAVPGSTGLPETAKHPKVVVRVSKWCLLLTGLIFVGQLEYNTKWACVLEKSPEYFHEFRRKGTNVQARQSVDAIFQLYGYMTFNDNKYGILNNMEHAYVFRRIETADSGGKSTGQSILMIRSIRRRSQVCSKPLWAPFCLPKLHLPGFIVPRPLPKHPSADISMQLPQPFVTVMQLFCRRSRTIQSLWTDHIRFCHLTLVFAISTVVPCVILHDEALR